MANKAEIKANIQSVLTLNASKTSRAEHEQALHTNSASLLENIYGNVINETEAAPSIFSVVNPNIEYNVNVMKVGRRVTIAGFIKNASASETIIDLLTIDSDEYKSTDNFRYHSNAMIEGDESVVISVFNWTLGTNFL